MKFRSLAIALFTLAAVLAGCARTDSGVQVIGDVHTVLAGQCTPDTYEPVDSSTVVGALGAGTLAEPAATGEMMTLFGRTFVKSTDPATGYATQEAASFRTPFAMLVPAGDAGRARRVELPGEVTLSEMLAERVGGAAFVALVHCRDLAVSAIRVAPIYGEPIQGEGLRAKYFHPARSIRGRWALLFGVAVDPKDASGPAAKRLLRRGFYVNKADASQSAGAALQYHVHGWVLRAEPPGDTLADRARSAEVEEVIHVLGQSRVRVEQLDVYPLEAGSAGR